MREDSSECPLPSSVINLTHLRQLSVSCESVSSLESGCNNSLGWNFSKKKALAAEKTPERCCDLEVVDKDETKLVCCIYPMLACLFRDGMLCQEGILV